jgi:fructose-specific phosphotransferase system IIC component
MLRRHYGMGHVKASAQFTAFCLFEASVLSLAARFTGEFSPIYLYLDLAFIAVSLVCAWLFATPSSPRLAYILTFVCMMGTASLICLAMILGSI